MWCLIFVFVLGSISVSDAKLPLPPYIQACHKDDPNIDACALKNAKLAIPQLLNGDKTYGIPKLNPLELETVKVETGGNLTISLNNVKVSGLESIDVKSVKVDFTSKSLHFDFSVDILNILGNYQMDGKILVIPLKGNGDCNLTASNVVVKFVLHYNLIEKDGDMYAQLRESDTDIDLDNVHFQFDNLFNGNEELAPYIQACHKDDPNIDACALKNAKLAIPQLLNGDKTYGIPKLNPLELETVKVETGGNLTISLNNVKVSGLESIEVKSVKVDFTSKSLHFDFSVDILNILGNYQMDGKILVIPLKGNGDCNLTASNVVVKFILHYDLIEKDGDTYAQLRESDTDIDLDNVHFQFDNLFNGNEELGRNTNTILNKEWKSLYTELKPALSNTVSTIAVTIATSVTDKVPFNMIFL